MFCAIVMILQLFSRILYVADFNVQSIIIADALNLLGEFVDRKQLGELVEDLQLTLVRRIIHRKLNTLKGVLEIEVTTGLSTLAVYGQRNTGNSLHQEAVHDRAKYIVIMKIGEKPFVDI